MLQAASRQAMPATLDVASNAKRVLRLAPLVLLVHVLLIGWSALHHSPVAQEIAHLAAGASHIQLHQFDLFRVNPPLVRMTVAMPVALLTPCLDWRRLSADPLVRAEYAVEKDFVQANWREVMRLLVVARCCGILFSLAGAYVCYCFAAKLHGIPAGNLSLVLWCFCPYVLGHGATITPDVPAAAMGVAAAYSFWRWLKRPSWPQALLAGLVLGLAELCKFTLLVFYPMWPLLWVAYRVPEWRAMEGRHWVRQGGMLAAMVLVSVYTIDCGYLFENTFKPLEDFRFQSMLFTGCAFLEGTPPGGANRFDGSGLAKLPVPVPANFLQGIDTQRYDFERGLPSYLRGQWAGRGWWYYYLYALLVKMPLGAWLLAALAAGVTILGRSYAAPWRDEMVVLAPFAAILILVSSQSGFSIHSRYVIPALPFLFVWTGKAARALGMTAGSRSVSPSSARAPAGRHLNGRRMALATTTVVATGWFIGSSLSVYPHSLSYFNELVTLLPTPADASYPEPANGDGCQQGTMSRIVRPVMTGPRLGPRHLLGSNIDWGQDMLHLKNWLDQHPGVRLDGLAGYGSCSPTLAGIPKTAWPPIVPIPGGQPGLPPRADLRGPRPGWYALSVNHIYDRSRRYRYFLDFEPVATAGYSIYLYHITPGEANRLRRKLGLAELPSENGNAP